MKEFIKENWFKIIIVILPSIIIFGYIFIQYNYYQKQQLQIQLDIEKQGFESLLKKERLELEKNREKKSEERQTNLNKCLADAEENFELTWNSTCSNGIGNWINICQGVEGENCTQCILPDKETDRLTLSLEKIKEDCYKKFSICCF